MIAFSEIKTAPAPETRSAFPAIGLVIPFQPCMQDKRTIKKIFSYTLEVVRAKLEGTYEASAIRLLTERLEKIFSGLNYNSHRKSIAVMLSQATEKVIYLDFAGKPVVFYHSGLSLLDLVAASVRNPGFQLLMFSRYGAEVFDYFNNKLHKVYAQKTEPHFEKTGEPACLFRQVSNILKLVNSKNDKPVFISGNQELAGRFYESFHSPEIVFSITPASAEPAEKIPALAAKVKNQWDYWQSKLISGQLAHAERWNHLISGHDLVLKALRRGADGLLLIDSSFLQQVHQSPKKVFDELTDLVEKFLIRGNRVEIAQMKLAEDFGGIAFILREPAPVLSKSYRPHHKKDPSDFIF